MYDPLAHTKAELTPKRLVPWAVFTALLVAAVVAYFVYADRVPSLLQALADR